MSSDDKTRMMPEATKATVGTQLSGIYELDERIASGGMGEVYRGHNIQTGDHVAIKIVLPEFARDQTILSLFRKEALILNHLSHDAVVRYHVFTIDPGIGRPYLAMEFVNGESLFDVMRRGAMPTNDVRRLCHRLASGLSAVHEAGAVHRDLSPDNIILPGGKVERAKIIDFGIARSAAVDGGTLIGGKFAGKYNYVSPEQLGLYGGEVSERSDIYSLGLVLAAALRGKPIDMGGSQFEIVEKRRTVPDLSDLDGDLGPLVEAMLQPDPRDRPTSMAEIAEFTHDGPTTGVDRATAPPSTYADDRRTARSQAEPAAPTHSRVVTQDSISAGEPPFVAHRPPAHLSRSRPVPTADLPVAASPRRSNGRNIAIAALAAVAILSGIGLYLSGLLAPSRGTPTLEASQSAQLTPELAKPSVAETALPADQSAKAPSQARTAVPAAPTSVRPAPDSGGARESVPPARETIEARPSKDKIEPPKTSLPKIAGNQGQEALRTTEELVPPSAPTRETSAPQANRAKSTDSQPKETARLADESPSLPLQARETASRPTNPSDNGQDHEAIEPATKSATSPTPREPPAPTMTQPADEAASLGPPSPPASSGQGQTNVATYVPQNPTVPATNAIDEVARRISWLRDYHGGECFYATATSVTDKAIEIEGFGTEVRPFEQMLEAFQSEFHLEPDISVRLIEPAQCEVTHFLRALGGTSAERPDLALDQSSVPNGAPVSGTLKTLGGLRSSLLLIDNKGMAFNLDERVTVQSGKAMFSIPISLGDADKAAGRGVPQIIIAITGTSDVQAATFSNPTPAATALPQILAEIKEKGLEFSATAKYFRLGG